MEERLKVEHLSVSFFTDEGEVQAVRMSAFPCRRERCLLWLASQAAEKVYFVKAL